MLAGLARGEVIMFILVSLIEYFDASGFNASVIIDYTTLITAIFLV